MGALLRFLIISFSAFFLPKILCNHSDHIHDCAVEKFCSPEGPAVRFPFRLLGKQPEYCGYNSSYNLQCDEFNRTILELPSWPARVIVTNISYQSQMIEVRSPEKCFAKQLRDLDIYETPFRYYYSPQNLLLRDQNDRYSLFNCSGSFLRDCLATDGYYVHKIPTDEPFSDYLPFLTNCTKMFDTKLFPTALLDDPPYPSVMNLSWSMPSCIMCEKRDGKCRWKNRNTNQIGCFGGNNPHSGTLKKLKISGPIIGCILLVPAVGVIFFLHSKLEEQKEKQIRMKKFLEDYAAMKPTRYLYADIKKITNNFKAKLGEGAYGSVFKGQISNKIFVAVKLLHNFIGDGDDFMNEVGTMGTIHHVNVVRLLGFCADRDKRALVYEFLPNGSLDKFLFSDDQANQTLGMGRMQNIAIGIARGIKYLHQGCQRRILHFDIKPQNILLDGSYNPKISDFGLAKLCERGKSAVSMTAARGTMGYIAPEVFSRQFGNVSYKSDIYSFGMLLLEMVGRRKNIDATVQNISQVYFPEWLYESLVSGKNLIIQIDEEGDDEITKRLAIVGLWCIQWNPFDRPSITSVIQMLEGTSDNLSLPSNPFASSNVSRVDSSEHISPFNATLVAISESE